MTPPELPGLVEVARGDAHSRHGDTLSTLARGLRVLEFVATNEGVAPKQVAAALGLALGTTYHLVNTLLDEGYLERDRTGGLLLGDGFGSLVERLDHRIDPYPQLQPLLADVAERCGDVAVIGRLVGHHAVITALQEAPGAAHAGHLHAGLRGPSHTMALGKVLLAVLEPAATLAALRDHRLEALTERTITSVDDVLDELEIVRRRRFAIDVEEGEPDLCCVAAPIVSPGSRPIALAVAVTPDRLRHRPEALAALVAGGARRASMILAR